jgi:hypothetical protein
MRKDRRSWLAAPLWHALIIAAIASVSTLSRTLIHSPPRYDGAGYAVLARALATGQGYRGVDRPDLPRHAHFPPGYPWALSLVWRCTGMSVVSAHLFSATCTALATLVFWAWLRRLYAARVALFLGLALAVNWAWCRIGGSIQSEPLYFLMSGLRFG